MAFVVIQHPSVGARDASRSQALLSAMEGNGTVEVLPRISFVRSSCLNVCYLTCTERAARKQGDARGECRPRVVLLGSRLNGEGHGFAEVIRNQTSSGKVKTAWHQAFCFGADGHGGLCLSMVLGTCAWNLCAASTNSTAECCHVGVFGSVGCCTPS